MMRLLALALLLALTAPAAAEYPDRPVRLIIPFPPGGSNDVVGRLVANQLSEKLGHKVYVDNRGGAGGVLGTEAAATAAPDGYTLLVISIAHAVNPALYKLTYDPVKSFVPVSIFATGPNVLVVNPQLPVHSVKELVALAKQKPGELVYGSSGIGTTTHLAGELVNVMAGVKLTHVPYPGSAQSMTDVLTGRIPLLFVPAAPAMQYVEKGQLKAIAVTQAQRSSVAPNVPTMAEAGLPGYDIGLWFALCAPAGTPKEIVDKIAKATGEAMAAPDIKAALLAAGVEPVTGSNPETFARYIDSEIKKGAEVAKAAGLAKR
jgi:tripartite-type tricarboxylate transporter receptor subunit TctC